MGLWILVLLAAALARPVVAEDVVSTWATAADGVWNNNSNWNNAPAVGGFPNNGGLVYDALIDAVGSDYTVTLNTAIIIEDFTLNSADATVNHTSNIFRVTSVADLLAGTFQLNGGTIQQGVWNLSGGQLSFSNNSNNRLDAVALNGDVNLTGSAHRVRLLNGASFTGDAMLSGTSAVLGYE